MNFQDIVGKTIQSAMQVKRPIYDDEGYLLLEFTDGSKCVICSWYDRYTGNSEDEYRTGISISDQVDGFVQAPAMASEDAGGEREGQG